MKRLLVFLILGLFCISHAFSINYKYTEDELFGTVVYERRAYEDDPQILFPGSSLKYFIVENGTSSANSLPIPESRKYENKFYHVFLSDNPDTKILLDNSEYEDFLKLMNIITSFKTKDKTEKFLFKIYQFSNVTYDNLYKRVLIKSDSWLDANLIDSMAELSSLLGGKTYKDWVDPIKLQAVYDIKNNTLDTVIEFTYMGSDWLYLNKAVLLVNDNIYEIQLEKVTRDALPKGSVVESAKVLGSAYTNVLNLIKEVDFERTDKEDLICRFYGDSHYADFYYSKELAKSINLLAEIESFISTNN